MNILPNLKDVRRFAASGKYKVVPISCEILSDICTSIEAMRILKNVSTHCYMLESAQQKIRHWKLNFWQMRKSLQNTICWRILDEMTLAGSADSAQWK